MTTECKYKRFVPLTNTYESLREGEKMVLEKIPIHRISIPEDQSTAAPLSPAVTENYETLLSDGWSMINQSEYYFSITGRHRNFIEIHKLHIEIDRLEVACLKQEYEMMQLENQLRKMIGENQCLEAIHNRLMDENDALFQIKSFYRGLIIKDCGVEGEIGKMQKDVKTKEKYKDTKEIEKKADEINQAIEAGKDPLNGEIPKEGKIPIIKMKNNPEQKKRRNSKSLIDSKNKQGKMSSPEKGIEAHSKRIEQKNENGNEDERKNEIIGERSDISVDASSKEKNNEYNEIRVNQEDGNLQVDVSGKTTKCEETETAERKTTINEKEAIEIEKNETVKTEGEKNGSVQNLTNISNTEKPVLLKNDSIETTQEKAKIANMESIDEDDDDLDKEVSDITNPNKNNEKYVVKYCNGIIENTRELCIEVRKRRHFLPHNQHIVDALYEAREHQLVRYISNEEEMFRMKKCFISLDGRNNELIRENATLRKQRIRLFNLRSYYKSLLMT